MPIYEYRCEACGHELEALQKMSDDPLVDCPACGQAQLKKRVSAAAFRLKGGGWYETDFKADKRKNLAGDVDKAGDKKTADKTASESSGTGDKGSTDKSASKGSDKSSAQSSSKASSGKASTSSKSTGASDKR